MLLFIVNKKHPATKIEKVLRQNFIFGRNFIKEETSSLRQQIRKYVSFPGELRFCGLLGLLMIGIYF